MPFLKKWVCFFYINDEKFLMRIGHSRVKRILRWVPILHGASLVAQMVKNMPAMQETQFHPWVKEDSLEKGLAAHSSILDWSTPWTEELGELQSVHGVTKTQLSD